MKECNFDPISISHVAREMLIWDMAPLGSIKSKVEELDYGEDIPIEDDDSWTSYHTVDVNEIRDTEVNADITRILNVNCQMIIIESENLQSRLAKLTESQI